MSEEDVINCTISFEIHQYVFSCVYILILLVSEHLDNAPPLGSDAERCSANKSRLDVIYECG